MSDPHQVSYDQPTKNDARRLALSHAVELVTSRRENAAIVPADHTKRIRDHLLKESCYGDRAVALACAPKDLDSWCSFRRQTVGTRTSCEITVAGVQGNPNRTVRETNPAAGSMVERGSGVTLITR